MLVALEVGDWSQDGHNQAQTFFVETNLNLKELSAAHLKGCEILGVPTENLGQWWGGEYPPIDQYASAYEQNQFPKWLIEKVHELTGEELTASDEGEDYALETDWYVMLYLDIAKIGNPELVFEVLSPPSIPIGGYGLFYV